MEELKKEIKIFRATEKVYHYTFFETACKIISSNRLRFGSAIKTNDINEVYRRICIPVDSTLSGEEVQKELSKYRQLCFSKDNSPRCGYNIPVMWGHYANVGNGICLVFDKSKIKRQLKPEMVAKDVTYVEDFSECVLVKGDVQDFIDKKKESIFFTKTKDWSYEQEWRILVRADSETLYLPLEDSLIAIIMDVSPDIDSNDCVFNSENAKMLKKLAPRISMLRYGLWCGSPTISDEAGEEWSEQEKWEVDV
ncbi:MAG: DUF2971 domain-containing protein [Lachnospiraceae bacterium]|nr:DUF2971 domain-containing protein [Lachnospiraceae bacterium]